MNINQIYKNLKTACDNNQLTTSDNFRAALK